MTTDNALRNLLVARKALTEADQLEYETRVKHFEAEEHKQRCFEKYKTAVNDLLEIAKEVASLGTTAK